MQTSKKSIPEAISSGKGNQVSLVRALQGNNLQFLSLMNRKKELGIENKQGMWNEEMDNGFKFSLKSGSFSHMMTFWCHFSVEFVNVKNK